jgi:hypothetical protein
MTNLKLWMTSTVTKLDPHRHRAVTPGAKRGVSRGIFALILLLGLLGWAGYRMWTGSQTPAASYSPADVVYGEPLHVVQPVSLTEAHRHMFHSADLTVPQPSTVISDPFYDFGRLSADQDASHIFSIANQGEAVLVIMTAQTTCGCTTADLTATEIPPGKVALMTVHFDAKLHPLRGQTVRRGVMLETNDPRNPVLEFWIQAAIR